MKKPNGNGSLIPDLPSWVPLEAWEGWLEVRKLKKVPNTERALRVALGKLERLMASGQDAEKVIDQSIERGWTTFYPFKDTAECAKPPEPEKKKVEPMVPEPAGVPMPEDVRAKMKNLIKRMH